MSFRFVEWRNLLKRSFRYFFLWNGMKTFFKDEFIEVRQKKVVGFLFNSCLYLVGFKNQKIFFQSLSFFILKSLSLKRTSHCIIYFALQHFNLPRWMFLLVKISIVHDEERTHQECSWKENIAQFSLKYADFLWIDSTSHLVNPSLVCTQNSPEGITTISLCKSATSLPWICASLWLLTVSCVSWYDE